MQQELLQNNHRKGATLFYVAIKAKQKLGWDMMLTIIHPTHPTSCQQDVIFQQLDIFLREESFQTQDQVETAFSEFIISRFPDFYDTSIKKKHSNIW